MVEISLEASSDTKTNLCGDNKCSELQLSSLNVHRGLLSFSDHTNHDNNACMENKMTFDSLERKDQSETADPIAEAENQPCPSENLEDEPLLKKIKYTPEQRRRGKATRKRRRAPWRPDIGRKQRSANRRPSRAEMPYDELIKLREKERIAQQQRRARLRKAEAKNFPALKHRVKKSCVTKPVIRNQNYKDTKEGCDVKNVGLSEEIELGKCLNPTASSYNEKYPNSVQSFVDPKTDSVTKKVVFGAQNNVHMQVRRNTVYPVKNKKIAFMLALGLVFAEEPKTDDLSGLSSDERIHQDDITDSGSSKFQENQELYDTQLNSMVEDGFSRSSDDQSKADIQFSDEASVSSFNEECLAAATNTTSGIEDKSVHQTKSASGTSQLENEVERPAMAPVCQIARDQIDSFPTSQHTYETLDIDDNSHIDNQQKPNQGSPVRKHEVTSSDEGIIENAREEIKTVDEEMVRKWNGKSYNSRTASQSDDMGKRLLNRFCNRSMLNPEELENLRKREREYQRKRRARLREQKLKDAGEIFKKVESSSMREISSDAATTAEDVSRKPETRRSNGISCPSQKFLESSEAFYVEKKSEKPSEMVSCQEENDYDLKESMSDNLKLNGRNSPDYTATEIVCRNSMRYSQQNDNYCSLKNIPRGNTDTFYDSKERRSPFLEALYASDYKRKESSGYFSNSPEPRFQYKTDACSRIEAALKYEWENTKTFSKMTNDLLFDDKYYYGKSLQNHLELERMKELSEARRAGPIGCRRNQTTEAQKWRHWKSGLSDDQLQRRRLSNREAQRRRRLRLKMMQMSSSQQQNINMEDLMYKRNKVGKASDLCNSIKPYSLPKTKLDSILEKRHKVFLDAQMEKSKNKTEDAVNAPSKSRGCRVKVTPQRLVVVPPMSYMDDTEGGNSNRDFHLDDFHTSPRSIASPAETIGEFPCTAKQEIYSELKSSPLQEEPVLSTSNRKRKQFCPRRLLTDAERRHNESMQRLPIAQY